MHEYEHWDQELASPQRIGEYALTLSSSVRLFILRLALFNILVSLHSINFSGCKRNISTRQTMRQHQSRSDRRRKPLALRLSTARHVAPTGRQVDHDRRHHALAALYRDYYAASFETSLTATPVCHVTCTDPSGGRVAPSTHEHGPLK